MFAFGKIYENIFLTFLFIERFQKTQIFSLNHYGIIKPGHNDNFIQMLPRTRRMAVDYSVPLITDIKCAKLLVEALEKTKGKCSLLKILGLKILDNNSTEDWGSRQKSYFLVAGLLRTKNFFCGFPLWN